MLIGNQDALGEGTTDQVVPLIFSMRVEPPWAFANCSPTAMHVVLETQSTPLSSVLTTRGVVMVDHVRPSKRKTTGSSPWPFIETAAGRNVPTATQNLGSTQLIEDNATFGAPWPGNGSARTTILGVVRDPVAPEYPPAPRRTIRQEATETAMVANRTAGGRSSRFRGRTGGEAKNATGQGYRRNAWNLLSTLGCPPSPTDPLASLRAVPVRSSPSVCIRGSEVAMISTRLTVWAEAVQPGRGLARARLHRVKSLNWECAFAYFVGALYLPRRCNLFQT
jgi:hypothetical protein